MPCYTGEKDKALQTIAEKFPAVSNFLGQKKFLLGDHPIWLDFYFFEVLELCALITDGAVFDDFPVFA